MVILCDFNIQINNENHAYLFLNKLIFEYSMTQHILFTTKTNSNNIYFLADSKLISYPTQSSSKYQLGTTQSKFNIHSETLLNFVASHT